jgi:beta-N-acetylhexosaminidase
MVGHVAVDALDDANPASVSPAVLSGLLRQQWRFNGILISDDMTMAPIYNRGLCRSAVDSLNAGMDLILIAYDWKKYYSVMDCLRHAKESGALRNLEQSQERLRTFGVRRLAAVFKAGASSRAPNDGIIAPIPVNQRSSCAPPIYS